MDKAANVLHVPRGRSVSSASTSSTSRRSRRRPAYTRVAHAPDEVLGLVNIRGHIYLALDLRRLLGIPSTSVTSDSRLVLFKPAVGNAFGVVVDEISDIQTVDADRIGVVHRVDHEAAAANVGRVDLIDCVCELDGELLVVLNPRRFLAVDRTESVRRQPDQSSSIATRTRVTTVKNLKLAHKMLVLSA